jgi:hypothetical protein
MNLRPFPTRGKCSGPAKMPNPWARPLMRFGSTEAIDAATRMEIVREASAERLRAMIDWPGTQMTVRRAAVSRLRKLQRISEIICPNCKKRPKS